MTAISGIDTGFTNPATQAGVNDVSLGKQDFLKLLVAQLENQDPMNPDDPTEFTAQLAQFSQLEQLTNVNQSLEGLNTMSSEMQRMSALGLIGQEVVAQSDQFSFDGESIQLGYDLETAAEDVTLFVLNQSGSTLAEIPGTETGAGQHFIDWDGTTDLGAVLEAGDYSLAIKAVDKDDQSIDANGLVRGRVEAVDMSSSEAQLDTSSGIFALSRIEKAGTGL